MKNHDDIWKQMTTPKEIEAQPYETFNEVKKRFNDIRALGTCIRCPMSGTIHNMPYLRSISKSMAKALKILYRIQVSKINDGTPPNAFSDFTKLRYWGLIRQDESGYWRITENGIAFVEGRISIAKYAIIVNNVQKQFMGDSLSIHDIMAK